MLFIKVLETWKEKVVQRALNYYNATTSSGIPLILNHLTWALSFGLLLVLPQHSVSEVLEKKAKQLQKQ